MVKTQNPRQNNSYLRMGRDREKKTRRKSHVPVVENRDCSKVRSSERSRGTSALSLIGSLAVAAGLIGSSVSAYKRFDGQYLNSEDFQNAKWVQIDNSDGIIWDDYTKSGIPQNGVNWTAYQMEVKDRNDGNLAGSIYVPVFDKR